MTVENYDLEAPSRDELLRALERVLGMPAATSVWDHACLSIRIDPSATEITPANLLKVVNVLLREQGLVGVVAKSFWVRAKTWEILSRRTGAPTPSGDCT